MSFLHLDGFHELRQTFNKYGWHEDKNQMVMPYLNPEDGKEVKAYVWLRLALPFHGILTYIRTIGCQSLRASASLVAGVLTLDLKLFISGLNDAVSVVIQAIALPIIIIVGIVVNPLYAFAALHNSTRESSSYDEDLLIEDHPPHIYLNSLRTSIADTIRGILGAPSILLARSTRSMEFFLRGRVKQAAKEVGEGLLTFVRFPLALTGGCSPKVHTWTLALHRVTSSFEE